MFGSRIDTKSLAMLCRRLGTSLGAGVDARMSFLREAQAARGSARRPLQQVSDEVAGGSGVAEAFDSAGNYVPEFFRAMIHVGEDSGQLPEVLRRLSDNYEHQLKLRRTLSTSLAWPVVELCLALTVVGIVIWV